MGTLVCDLCGKATTESYSDLFDSAVGEPTARYCFDCFPPDTEYE